MSRIGRMTIGLYNTYDPKRFAEAHRRVLVRVGPVATAFECNVALFGFPFPEDIRTPVELAEWLSAGTSIGEGGQYFIELAEAGRVSLFPYPAKGFPPQFGDVVATTRKPDGKKSISAAEVASRLAGGRSCLLVFGLGPHGLPEKARDICNEHLDITGKGITLETCTALGIVPAVLHTLASGASFGLSANPSKRA